MTPSPFLQRDSSIHSKVPLEVRGEPMNQIRSAINARQEMRRMHGAQPALRAGLLNP
jgi:hypothetical protein